MSATRQQRADTVAARDDMNARLAAAGHAMTWKLGENATRKGYLYFFDGTCEHCGAFVSVDRSGSTSHGARDARRVDCSGPGTAVLTQIEQARLSELMAEAVAEFCEAIEPVIRDVVDSDFQSVDEYKTKLRDIVAQAQATRGAAEADARCAEADLNRLTAACEWLTGKRFDPATLADAQDMIDNAEKRLAAERARAEDAQRRLETAETALTNLISRVGRVQEAINESPVRPAVTDAYSPN